MGQQTVAIPGNLVRLRDIVGATGSIPVAPTILPYRSNASAGPCVGCQPSAHVVGALLIPRATKPSNARQLNGRGDLGPTPPDAPSAIDSTVRSRSTSASTITPHSDQEPDPEERGGGGDACALSPESCRRMSSAWISVAGTFPGVVIGGVLSFLTQKMAARHAREASMRGLAGGRAKWAAEQKTGELKKLYGQVLDFTDATAEFRMHEARKAFLRGEGDSTLTDREEYNAKRGR
jgi:hypothetical protein